LIYIGIPVHNEGRTIGVQLWKIRKVMAEFGRPYEVSVFDDASTDGTSQTLANYVGRLPLRVTRSEIRAGYGLAIERLIRSVVARSTYPKRDVAVTLQGDFSEDPTALVAMVKRIEGGADLVAGSPSPIGSSVPRPVRIGRGLAPLVLGRAFAQAPVTDPLSGFRAYRVIVLKKAVRQLGNGERLLAAAGWGANLELLCRVASHARRIEEEPFPLGVLGRERESRFRAFPGLRELVGLRSTVWPPAHERS